MKFSCFRVNLIVLTLLCVGASAFSVVGALAVAITNEHPGYVALMIPFAAVTMGGTIFGLLVKVTVTEEGLSVNKGRVIPWSDISDVEVGLRLDAQPAGVQRFRYGTQEQVKIKYHSRGKSGILTLDGTARDYQEIRELILSKVKLAPKGTFDDL